MLVTPVSRICAWFGRDGKTFINKHFSISLSEDLFVDRFLLLLVSTARDRVA
jgi:hypothetical protein